jgi:hypothetical protein
MKFTGWANHEKIAVAINSILSENEGTVKKLDGKHPEESRPVLLIVRFVDCTA